MTRTLGTEIRGARLGYGWCDELGAYVRLVRRGEATLVDIRPSDDVPRRSEGDEMHVVWWEHDDTKRAVGRELRRMVAGGLRRVHVRRRISFEAPG